jgi:RNA polymerase sigma factor (sigma-70 family)
MSLEAEKIRHDRQLLAAALDDAPGAADRLLREITPGLRAIVRKRTRKADAEEVLADLLSALWAHGWRKLRAWKQDAPLSHYLSVIAVNHCHDVYRREHRRLRGIGSLDDAGVADIPATDPDAEHRLALRQAQACLREGLAVISPTQRAVLTLRHAEQLAHREIAGRLKKTMGYVAGTLARAEAALRRRLKGACADLVADILRSGS